MASLTVSPKITHTRPEKSDEFAGAESDEFADCGLLKFLAESQKEFDGKPKTKSGKPQEKFDGKPKTKSGKPHKKFAGKPKTKSSKSKKELNDKSKEVSADKSKEESADKSKEESGKPNEESAGESKETSFGIPNESEVNTRLAEKFPDYSDDENKRTIIGRNIVNDICRIANDGGRFANILLPNNAGKSQIACSIMHFLKEQCEMAAVCVNTTLLRTQWMYNYIDKNFRDNIAKFRVLSPGSTKTSKIGSNFEWMVNQVKNNPDKKYFIVFDEAFSKCNSKNHVYLAFKKFLGKLPEAVMPKGQKSKNLFKNVFLLTLGAPLDFSIFKEYYEIKNPDGTYQKYLDYLEDKALGGEQEFKDPFEFIPVSEINRQVYSVKYSVKGKQNWDDVNIIASKHLCTESNWINDSKIVIICPNRASSQIVHEHVKGRFNDSFIIIGPPSEKLTTGQKRSYYLELTNEMKPLNKNPVIVILHTGSFEYGIRFESMDRLILMPGVLKHMYVSEKDKKKELTRKVELTQFVSLLDRAGKNNSQVRIYMTYSKNNMKNIEKNEYLKAWLGSESSCDHQIITAKKEDAGKK